MENDMILRPALKECNDAEGPGEPVLAVLFYADLPSLPVAANKNWTNGNR